MKGRGPLSQHATILSSNTELFEKFLRPKIKQNIISVFLMATKGKALHSVSSPTVIEVKKKTTKQQLQILEKPISDKLG